MTEVRNDQNRAPKCVSREFVENSKRTLTERRAALELKYPSEGVLQPYLRSELVKVKFALKRIEQEQYGLCCNCGCLIELELLEVVPESPFCLYCLRTIEAN